MRKDKLVIRFVIVILLLWLVIHFYNMHKRKTHTKNISYVAPPTERPDTVDMPTPNNLQIGNEFEKTNDNIDTSAALQTNSNKHAAHLKATPVLGKTDNTIYPLLNVYSRPMTKQETRERLGRSTWTLLHTMAAVYPGIVSQEHKSDMLRFLHLLSKLYPCGDCAQHFQQLLTQMPPKLDNHDEFAQWMCEAHNVVNDRLGKEKFECGKVDTFWECGCEG